MRTALMTSAAALLVTAIAMPGQGAKAASSTTEDALLNSKSTPENWLTVHGHRDGSRYSPLDQINKSNVKDLNVKWTLGLGGIESGGFWKTGNIEGTPLVEDGTMYMPNGYSVLYSVDLRKADQGGPDMINWIYDPAVDKDWAGNVTCCAINNRGVGLWQDAVIMNTLDGRMLSVAKADGSLNWSIQLAEPAIAETVTVAPLIVKDMAISGVSGAEYGIRGWIAAVDLNTGEEKWRRYTVPGPGEAGNETWADDYDAWKTGGGSTWQTGSYDPDLNLVYWGVGNPGPDWDHEYRPGDNLYTSGMIAVNPDNGQVQFHFQYTPNDPYDYDGINELVLVDNTVGGSDRKAFIHADRNGFFYAVDRTNGEFIYGIPFVKEVTWTKGLDKTTGLPLEYDPNSQLQSYVAENTPSRSVKKAKFCPNLMGGKNWMPIAYNPDNNTAFVPTIESCIYVSNEEEVPGPDGSFVMREWFSGGLPSFENMVFHGSLTAIDVGTGRIKKKVDTRYPLMAGVLTTAGGLTFVAHHEGRLVAYDADTMDELWSFNMNVLTDSPTMTYGVDGKQYIAVGTGGWGAMPHYFMGANPGLEKMNTANMEWVFGL
ncbi:MAG: quinonprotein alcohol dehydrogenase [Rhodospirillaceae bacterium]|nr:quinonprotein alcohol dehydrogenase [Rhodospirillaceae bacterium]